MAREQQLAMFKPPKRGLNMPPNLAAPDLSAGISTMYLEPTAFTRRQFIGRGIVLASAATTIPAFLNASGNAMAAALGELSSLPGVPDDHVLVVIQMSGGNDGLNTVVPYGHAEYYKSRPGISTPEKEALKLSGSTD